MSRALSSCLFLAALAGSAAAQADVVYTNISSSAGLYHDCLVLWTSKGQRPIASENTGEGRTGSVRKPRYRSINGRDYLYWINAFPSNGLYRGTDKNGNGVIDSSETETLFDFTALPGDISDGHFDEVGGTWAVATGRSSNAASGVWLMKDGNNDGDFMDAGEASQIVKGPTITIGTTVFSSDDCRAVGILSDGTFIYHEDDSVTWFRVDPKTGKVNVWLNYGSTVVVSGPTPAANPDFGTSLPAVSFRFDRIAVDHTTGDVYLAPNFSVSANQRYVFKAVDKNKDGDVNDTGEVTMFMDGTKQSPAWGPIDDIDFMNGSVYGSFEIDTVNDPGSQFWSLTDKNKDGDAMDPGEYGALGRTAKNDDPTMIGFAAVPAGAFGTSCVNAELENDTTLKAAGGTLKFTVKDIPAGLQGDKTFAFTAFSLTGDAGVQLKPGCTLGLTPDALTLTLLPIFVSTELTASTYSLPDLVYPAIPKGTKLYFASFFVRASDFTWRGVTGSGLLEAQ